MKEFEIVSKQGVNVTDNALNYSTTYKVLVKRFRLGESENLRRSRCLSYIINFATQAFIFDENYKAFITKVELIEEEVIRDKQ